MVPTPAAKASSMVASVNAASVARVADFSMMAAKKPIKKPFKKVRPTRSACRVNSPSILLSSRSRITAHCLWLLQVVKKVVKKPIKKVVKKPIKKVVKKPFKKPVKKIAKKVVRGGRGTKPTFSEEAGKIGSLAGSAITGYGGGNGAALFSSPVIIGVTAWILILLRFVLFYGAFGDDI